MHVGRRMALVLLCTLAGGCGQERIRELEARNRHLQKEIRELSQRVEERDEELDKTKKIWNSRLASTREHSELLQADRQKLQEQLATVTRARQRVDAEHRQSGQRLASARDELQETNELLLRARSERDRAQAQLAELRETLAAYRAEIENMTAAAPAPAREPETPASTGSPDTVSREEQVSELVTPTRERPLSRRDFASIVQGLSEDELVTYLGSPTRSEGSSPRYLIYNNPSTYAIRPTQRDAWVRIQMDNGVATFCYFP